MANTEVTFTNNISMRSKEGYIGQNQWNIFKQFCIWCTVAVLIPFFITVITGGIFTLLNTPDTSFSAFKSVINILQICFLIVIIIVTLLNFFRCSDDAVNNFIKRKTEFYNMVYETLIEKYSFTNEELAELKIKKDSFKYNCRLKSYYLIPIGLFGPIVLLLCSFFLILLDYVSYIDIYYYCEMSFNDALLLFVLILILVFMLFFALPAYKRMSIWYIINENEKEIIDEISRLLISKHIIENPLNIEINKKFKKPYLLIVLACIVMPYIYFFVEIYNAEAEKKYLKMIYPVEDKLLEVLEY